MAGSRSIGTVRLAVPLLLSGWLAACAGDASYLAFDLTPAASIPKRALRARVQVLDPIAPTDLDGENILVRTGPDALAVMAGARWAAPLPVLLQQRLTDWLHNAQAAPKADDAGGADYNLETDVRAFEFDASQKQVVVEIVVKLVSARDGHVAAVRTLKTHAPVASTDARAVTAAMNDALSDILVQLGDFIAKSG